MAAKVMRLKAKRRTKANSFQRPWRLGGGQQRLRKAWGSRDEYCHQEQKTGMNIVIRDKRQG